MPINEDFSFVTTYTDDTDIYYAHRTVSGYEVTVKYKNCEATVDFEFDEVIKKLRGREWVVLHD